MQGVCHMHLITHIILIYQNSNMITPRHSGHITLFGLMVLFVLKSPLGFAGQWSHEKVMLEF